MAVKIYLVEALEQGSVAYLHPAAGFKQCSNKGLQRAFKGSDGVVCPGCNRMCNLPTGFAHGQPFMVVKRPE